MDLPAHQCNVFEVHAGDPIDRQDYRGRVYITAQHPAFVIAPERKPRLLATQQFHFRNH
jgi:hypothetical protein